ncbi:hypothetical protein ATE49_15255 [Elizabethkingia miricola]|uniref:hypothetical protein n=1 Tax=Elizabethkingia miricola TaxID=172045 RepID=UPI0007EE83A3|nr:hypothetical protein [Elizabethkingia miricola]OBS12968.1 hypothetical protein ATE49_15255 [Elizabethkingia miricola]
MEPNDKIKKKAAELIQFVKSTFTDDLESRIYTEAALLMAQIAVIHHLEMHKNQWIDEVYYKEFREHSEDWINVKQELENQLYNEKYGYPQRVSGSEN